MTESSSSLIFTVFLAALGLGSCSLQNFDALGSGVNNATGGLDQSVGGGPSDGGASTATEGGADTGGAVGTSSTGGKSAITPRTGGTSSVGGASSTGGASSAGGASGKLVNPSFESGSNGWMSDPASELGFPNSSLYSAFVQGPIGTATVHQGNYQLSIYNSTRAYQVKIYQVITGLSDGQYTFSGWFTRGTMTTAYLYATGCGGTDPAHSAIPLSDIWTAVSVTGIAVAGGHCEVGFYVEGNNPDWLNADDFAFTAGG